jgi:hypothetical protein
MIQSERAIRTNQKSQKVVLQPKAKVHHHQKKNMQFCMRFLLINSHGFLNWVDSY